MPSSCGPINQQLNIYFMQEPYCSFALYKTPP